MLRSRHLLLLTVPICLFILVPAVCAHAEEEIEDLIDIFESKGRILAVMEGRQTASLDLRINEAVVWQGARGDLGAFLTNKRFLVISTSSDGWHALSLRSAESANDTAFISPHIALLVTGGRAIGFDATARRFVEVQLPLRDELVAADAGKDVAVVITSGRAFGLAAGRSAFSEIDLRIRETLEELKVTSSKAVVRTSDRFLIFNATDAAWKERTLY